MYIHILYINNKMPKCFSKQLFYCQVIYIYIYILKSNLSLVFILVPRSLRDSRYRPRISGILQWRALTARLWALF